MSLNLDPPSAAKATGAHHNAAVDSNPGLPAWWANTLPTLSYRPSPFKEFLTSNSKLHRVKQNKQILSYPYPSSGESQKHTVKSWRCIKVTGVLKTLFPFLLTFEHWLVPPHWGLTHTDSIVSLFSWLVHSLSCSFTFCKCHCTGYALCSWWEG